MKEKDCFLQRTILQCELHIAAAALESDNNHCPRFRRNDFLTFDRLANPAFQYLLYTTEVPEFTSMSFSMQALQGLCDSVHEGHESNSPMLLTFHILQTSTLPYYKVPAKLQRTLQI